MRDSSPLCDLAINVTKKVVGRAKNPDAAYVGLEHLETDNPRIQGSMPAAASISVNTVFKPGDTLFGKLRPNLRKVAAADFGGYCSTDILVIRPLAGVDPSFLSHSLRSTKVLNHAAGTAFGTKMPRTAWGEIRHLAIFAPSLFEQRRVAEILDTLDEQISTTKHIVEKLKSAQQGLAAQLLMHGMGASEHSMDATIARVPSGWEVAPLEKFKSNRRPHLKTGPFGSSLKQDHWVDEGVPVVTIGSLGDGHFINSELLHISARTALSLSSYALEEGDIVFSRVADVGRSIVVGERENGWIMSSNMMWISLDQARVDPRFVRANIASNPRLRDQIRRFVNSSGRDVANAKIMNLLRFPWPPLDEQRAIADIIACGSEQIVAEQRRLEKLGHLRQGLMKDLLSGHVRISLEAST